MKILFKILLFVVLATNVEGAEYINCTFDNAPTSEVNGGVYSCTTGSVTLQTRNPDTTAAMDHATGSECFGGSGGCVKFYTHTEAPENSDRWLRYTGVSDGAQRNTRYLLKLPAATSFDQYSGKWSDSGGDWRVWWAFSGSTACGLSENTPNLSYNSTVYVIHSQGVDGSSCGSYQWCPNSEWGSGWYDAALTSCTEVQNVMYLSDYTDQWVCIELERNSSGHYKIYIDTQDGLFSGVYYWIDTTFSGDVPPLPIGAYLEGAGGGGAYYIDNIVVADSYIGPPTGFLGSEAHTAAGVTFSGCSFH